MVILTIMAKKKKTELRVSCDEDFKAQLIEIAKKEKRTLSGQVLYFLEKAIKDYSPGG